MSEQGGDGRIKRVADYQRLDELEGKLLQLQIDALRKDSEDHERRIRGLEEVAVQFKFILYLTMGGGLLGLLNLISALYLISEHLGK